MARERWWSLISVGTGASTLLGLLVADALEIAAGLAQPGQAHAVRGLAVDLDDPPGLVPAHRQHQRGRRAQRLHRAEHEHRDELFDLHVDPRGARRGAAGQAGQRLHAGVQVAVAGGHQPARVSEHEALRVGWADADELAVHVAPPRIGSKAHDAQSLRALILELPALEGEAVRVAVVVFLARAHPAEGCDFLLLLLAELLLLAAGRLAERAPRQVVVDGGKLAAGFGRRAHRLAIRSAPRLGLAPLAIEEHQQLLAGGLHAVLAEGELGGRLALAQQADAVAQALGELAGVEIARLGGGARRRVGALRTAIAGQIRDQRRQALALVDRLVVNLELHRPALQQEGDERDLPLRELVRVRHRHQHSAGVGDARRGIVYIAVEKVLP